MSESISSDINVTHAQRLKRLYKEWKEVQENKNPFWTARPLDDSDPFEWHFTLRGPVGSEFEKGSYHGKMEIPNDYPYSAPKIYFLTQNGRFQVGQRVCITVSPYYPELWHPSWNFAVMLDAVHAFFVTPAEGQLNSLDWSNEIRTKLALDSVHWKCGVCQKTNKELIDENCLEISAVGPMLPPSMVPKNISQRYSYLKTKTSQDEVQESTSSSDAKPEFTEAQALEERRKRRRRTMASTNTLHQAFIIFVKSLIQSIYSVYNSYRTSNKLHTNAFVLDVINVLIILSIVYCLFSLYNDPNAFIKSFFVETL